MNSMKGIDLAHALQRPVAAAGPTKNPASNSAESVGRKAGTILKFLVEGVDKLAPSPIQEARLERAPLIKFNSPPEKRLRTSQCINESGAVYWTIR